MTKKKVTKSYKISYEIHDSWTELLVGSRYLLDLVHGKGLPKIQISNLVRLIIVSTFQMTENMFFHQLIEKVNSTNSNMMIALLEYDLEEKISFVKARNKWPKIIMGTPLPLGEEPLQSMKRLGDLRNSAIHYTATAPSNIIGESAFFTAIEASKIIYNFFKGECWPQSEYSKFSERYKSKASTFIASLI